MLASAKLVSSVDGSVRCTHFPSVAYPTESDETTDPMGGRRKTVGIPIDGLIYEVGPDVHLAADIFTPSRCTSAIARRLSTSPCSEERCTGRESLGRGKRSNIYELARRCMMSCRVSASTTYPGLPSMRARANTGQ